MTVDSDVRVFPAQVIAHDGIRNLWFGHHSIAISPERIEVTMESIVRGSTIRYEFSRDDIDYVGWDHQCVGIGRYSIRKWLHFVDHRGRKAPRLPVLVRPKDEEAAFAELRRCGWQLKR